MHHPVNELKKRSVQPIGQIRSVSHPLVSAAPVVCLARTERSRHEAQLDTPP
jgi:hypothetical protein